MNDSLRCHKELVDVHIHKNFGDFSLFSIDIVIWHTIWHKVQFGMNSIDNIEYFRHIDPICHHTIHFHVEDKQNNIDNDHEFVLNIFDRLDKNLVDMIRDIVHRIRLESNEFHWSTISK